MNATKLLIHRVIQMLSSIKQFTFKNRLWNISYLLTLSFAFATHSIWLAHCDICPDVPFWYNFVNCLPLVTVGIKPDLVLQILGTILVSIAVLIIEGLSNSNSSIRSKVLLNESEIIPLVVCSVVIVLMINDQTRITILLPILVFAIHMIIKMTDLVNLLRHPARLEVATQRLFEISMHESIKQHPISNDNSIGLLEIRELLNEQKIRYLNALSLGDNVEIQRSQIYFYLALTCIVKYGNEPGYYNLQKEFIQQLKTITSAVNQHNNLDTQKDYVRFIAKLYVYTIRNQDSSSNDIGMLFHQIMWLELEIRADKHQQSIEDEILRQFSDYIFNALVGSARDKSADAVALTRFYKILDSYMLLMSIAIERNQTQTTKNMAQHLTKWIKHNYEYYIENSSKIQPQHVYVMVRSKDYFLLIIQSFIFAQATITGKFQMDVFVYITELLAKSPLFPYLEQVVMTIEQITLMNEINNIGHMLRFENDSNVFLFERSKLIICITYMLMRTFLRKNNFYQVDYKDDCILDIVIIDRFISTIKDLEIFFATNKHIIHQFAELTSADIDELLIDLKNLKQHRDNV